MRLRPLLCLGALCSTSATGNAAPGAPRAQLGDPQLRALIAAAIRRAYLADDQVASWRRRLGWSSLLPRLSGRAIRSDGWAEYLDLRPDRPAFVDTNNHLTLRWEVRAAWDLGCLVFDRRELEIAAAARQIARQRQKLVERVARLYYQRARLLRETPVGTDEAVARLAQLGEATAVLEALAGRPP